MPEHDDSIDSGDGAPPVRRASQGSPAEQVRTGRPGRVVPETEVARLVAASMGADRVAVTLTSGSDHRSVVRGADPLLVALADREQSVGEGPTVDVLSSGRPLAVPDLHDAMARWPVLMTTHVSSSALRSLLVVPLAGPPGRPGDAARVVGVLVLARQEVRPFTTVEAVVADRLAALLSVMLQTRALHDADTVAGAGRAPGGQLDEALDPASQVLPLAVGQLMASEHLSEEGALGRLEHRAFTTGRSVYDAARDVVGTPPPRQRQQQGPGIDPGGDGRGPARGAEHPDAEGGSPGPAVENPVDGGDEGPPRPAGSC